MATSSALRVRLGALFLALALLPACTSEGEEGSGPEASQGPSVLAPDAGKLTLTPEQGKPLEIEQLAGECVSLNPDGTKTETGGAKDDPLSPPDSSSTRSCSFQPPAEPAEITAAPGRLGLSAPETESFVLSAISQPGPRPAESAPATPAASAAPAPATTIVLEDRELVFEKAAPGRYTVMLTGSSGGVWQFSLVVEKA